VSRKLANLSQLTRGDAVTEALARMVTAGSSPKVPISLLAFGAVVFRAELAVYLAALSALMLYERRISISRLISLGAISSFTSLCASILFSVSLVFTWALASIAVTLLVDSYFWQSWPWLTWPEMQGIYFNVVQGKSAEWGVRTT
jgi:alpha-1,6-mannosyltransferase